MSMRYTEAQAMCIEAKEEFLWQHTKSLVDAVRNESGKTMYEVRKLVDEYVKTLSIVNGVLDKLHHDFWVVHEDK